MVAAEGRGGRPPREPETVGAVAPSGAVVSVLEQNPPTRACVCVRACVSVAAFGFSSPCDAAQDVPWCRAHEIAYGKRAAPWRVRWCRLCIAVIGFSGEMRPVLAFPNVLLLGVDSCDKKKKKKKWCDVRMSIHLYELKRGYFFKSYVGTRYR